MEVPDDPGQDGDPVEYLRADDGAAHGVQRHVKHVLRVDTKGLGPQSNQPIESQNTRQSKQTVDGNLPAKNLNILQHNASLAEKKGCAVFRHILLLSNLPGISTDRKRPDRSRLRLQH